MTDDSFCRKHGPAALLEAAQMLADKKATLGGKDAAFHLIKKFGGDAGYAASLLQMRSHGGRQCGKTSAAIMALPKGGIFVCTLPAKTYTKSLAHALGRDDVRIETMQWLQDEGYMGKERGSVGVDHHAMDIGGSWIERFFKWKG